MKRRQFLQQSASVAGTYGCRNRERDLACQRKEAPPIAVHARSIRLNLRELCRPLKLSTQFLNQGALAQPWRNGLATKGTFYFL